MLKHAMPEDLIDKLNLQRLPPMIGLSPEEAEHFDNFECYKFPMPDRECNCWFEIFPGTMLINPNRLIFSAGRPDPAALSVPIEELYNRTLEEMQRYITVECKRFQHEEMRKAELN